MQPEQYDKQTNVESTVKQQVRHKVTPVPLEEILARVTKQVKKNRKRFGISFV